MAWHRSVTASRGLLAMDQRGAMASWRGYFWPTLWMAQSRSPGLYREFVARSIQLANSLRSGALSTLSGGKVCGSAGDTPADPSQTHAARRRAHLPSRRDDPFMACMEVLRGVPALMIS